MKIKKRGEERRMPFDIILMNSLIAGREGGRGVLRNFQRLTRRSSAGVISEKTTRQYVVGVRCYDICMKPAVKY